MSGGRDKIRTKIRGMMTDGVGQKYSGTRSIGRLGQSCLNSPKLFPKTNRNSAGDAVEVGSIAILHLGLVLASLWFMEIGFRKSEPRHAAVF